VARKWLDICGFEHISISPSTSTFKVCREHFTPNDFEGPAILRSDAVPTLFTIHSRALMDKQNPSSTKRFRSDMTNIHAKQPTSNSNNNIKPRTPQLSYRNTNYHRQQEQQQQQNQAVLSSPTGENFDDNSKQIINDTKQINDIDLNMNCSEEQLSDIQLGHCPVKVSL
jgi:hypothetical protein